MSQSISIRVKGRVQNVGFRFYTKKKADSLGIKGFVKNMPDGSVYAEAMGSQDILDLFMEFCKQGPEWARVDQINSQDIPPISYNGFEIH